MRRRQHPIKRARFVGRIWHRFGATEDLTVEGRAKHATDGLRTRVKQMFSSHTVFPMDMLLLRSMGSELTRLICTTAVF